MYHQPVRALSLSVPGPTLSPKYACVFIMYVCMYESIYVCMHVYVSPTCTTKEGLTVRPQVTRDPDDDCNVCVAEVGCRETPPITNLLNAF